MALTILQLLPALKMGGVETGTVDLARMLVAQGHRAIVVSSGGALVPRLEAAGAIHYTLPIHRKSPWPLLSLAAQVADLVETHGVDVIHPRSRVPAIIGFLAWLRVARRASFRLGNRQRIPCFVTTAHGYYARHLVSRVMGWGRLVIANSERIARHMIDHFGVPAERIRLIHRGVDLDQYPWHPPRAQAPRGEWRVASLGRIAPIKGHLDLLRAFGIVARSYPRARLSIVGEAARKDQGYLAQLKKLTLRLGLEGKVEFLESAPDVPAFLRQVDLLVLASVGEEAFGRVLIEAGAAGVPVVATRVGGVSEVVVDQKSGLLVPPGNPIRLGQAIVTLLKDRALAQAFSKAGRHRVESLFSLSRMATETLSVYREASERLRILVMKLSAVGDVVLVTPSLRALRARFPKAHLTVLVGRESRELLHRCPYLDELVVFDRSRDGSPLGLLRLAARLRASQVDLVVDFQNSRISHWLGKLCGAPLRYGYAGRRWSGCLTHQAVHPPGPLPPVEHQFHLLELLGIKAPDPRLELWPGPLDEQRVDGLLGGAWIAQNQPLVAVHPGGRWPSKRWPPPRYAELIDRLAAKARARVVLTGSAQERPLCEAIYRAANVKPILAAGRTSLNELAVLLGRCRAFVGGDTAALHMACAMQVPSVALFGPTDPARHLPPSGHPTLLKVDLPCSPCYRPTCYRSGSGHMECMNRISVEEVAQAVLNFVTAPVS